MHGKTKEEAKRLVESGIYTGCAIACASCGIVALEGMQCCIQKKIPVSKDTVHDIASIGKTMTASLIAILCEKGLMDANAPFTEYLTEHALAKNGTCITLTDLATHSSGFDNSKPYVDSSSAEEFEEKLMAKMPARPRGEAFEYACSNFIYLGKIVEKATGMDLDKAARALLWEPLGMNSTSWNPVCDNGLVAEYPPSSYQGTRKIGDHNDIACHMSPVPLGSGSVFTTIGDMMLFLGDLLRRERFSEGYYNLLFGERFCRGGYRRSFGWDMASENSPSYIFPRCGFSPLAIAHSGWTGGLAVVDPGKNFAGVFLGILSGDMIESRRSRAKILSMLAGQPFF